jgi:Fe-S-cluster containining protein
VPALPTAPHGETAWLGELYALFARVDALYADWSCPGSTECCRFGITGRQPYVTDIEASAIRHALAQRGGPLAPRKRALPLLLSEASERVCPLLGDDQRCSVYAARPLGCRTFYCGRARRGAGPERAELRELTRELQELAARHRMGGDAARPLLRVLESGWGG